MILPKSEKKVQRKKVRESRKLERRGSCKNVQYIYIFIYLFILYTRNLYETNVYLSSIF